MEPTIREEDGQFVVYATGPVQRCQTREEAEAVVEALRIFHSPTRPTQKQVQASLDRLAHFGIHQHQPNGILARQVASRLADAEKPLI